MNTAIASKTGVKRFVIAGHGLEAWLAANHLLASLGSRQIEITVCPVPGSDKLDDLYSIWPMGTDDGLTPIRISVKAMVQACRSSFSMGAKHKDLYRPYGTLGLDFVGTPFHHHWLRAFATGSPGSYFDWSPATVAMSQSRFAPPVPQNSIGSLQHGMALHIDTGLFTEMLRDRALRNGAVEASGVLSGVQRDNGTMRITGLDTSDGETLTAELYMDCSGLQRSLISDGPDASWVSAPGLDDYQITTNKKTTRDQPTPYHLVTVNPGGWELDLPGNGWKTQILIGNASSTNDSEPVSPGYFEMPWIENCVALGMASCSLLPVEPIHARYLAASLKRMIDLMPGADCGSRETVEYNNLARTDLVEILDLAALHEFFRKRDTNLASAEIHDSLKNRLDLFTQRGWVAPPDSEFFTAADWAATFIQLGLVPDRPDRLAGRIPPETLDGQLQNLRARIEKTAMEFPPLQHYLDAVNATARK